MPKSTGATLPSRLTQPVRDREQAIANDNFTSTSWFDRLLHLASSSLASTSTARIAAQMEKSGLGGGSTEPIPVTPCLIGSLRPVPTHDEVLSCCRLSKIFALNVAHAPASS
jgi:hypothetical protein